MNDEVLFLGNEAKRDVYLYYDIDKCQLGKGSYGTVQVGRLKGTQVQRAIKIIDKSKVSNVERFRLEVEIMFRLNHPSIIRLFDYFEDKEFIYLVLELCSGGELFDRIVEKKFYGEDEARQIFKQIAKAIHYCHLNGVCHRDLKPENFIMLSKNDPFLLKVIDFGLSRTFPNNQGDNGAPGTPPPFQNEVKPPAELDVNKGPKGRRQTRAVLKTKAGTPFYIAPEVLTGNYTEKCDVWSCGVILYILLCGYPPFYGDSNKEILESVKSGKLDFSSPEWKDKSTGVLEFIRRMIVGQDSRLFSDEVLRQPWMQSKNYQVDPKRYKEVVANMASFAKLSRLKKLVLYFVAHGLYEEDITFLHEYFYLFDSKGQGSVDEEGFVSVQRDRSAVEEKEARALFAKLDLFERKAVDYSLFVAAALGPDFLSHEKRLLSFFQVCNIDRSGVLSLKNLTEFFEIQFKYRVGVSKKFKFGVIQDFSQSKLLDADFARFKTAFKESS